MRILVVEDETDLGDVFRDFLLELGHQPLVVRSAEAALGRLATERPHAVILDLPPPRQRGLDFPPGPPPFRGRPPPSRAPQRAPRRRRAARRAPVPGSAGASALAARAPTRRGA